MRFSIIIPIYNAESTLGKCLSGILRQSYPDYQVILVDDGSTDGTLAAAKRWQDRDGRIVALQTDHAGAGAARNRGLARAEGEYVLFLDADDYWLRDDLLQTLDQRIEKHPTDVFMFQMVKVTDSGAVLKRYEKPRFHRDDRVLQLGDIYQDLVRDGQVLASCCNKCVRRELLEKENIRFRQDVYGEDIDWVLQLFCRVQTICLLNLDAYAYTQHKSESRSRSKDAPNDLVTIVDDWSKRLSSGNVSHAEAVAGLTAFEYGICMGSNHLLSPEKKACMRQNLHLLRCGLDKKTRLIHRVHGLFGYSLTCFAIRVYLWLRRIW